MNSLLEASPRTIGKIVRRMNLACFECGWNDCVCDLHHIVPQSKGGLDTHHNITYLCPNCHRKAHNGQIVSFRSLHEVIGESWKEYYDVTPFKKTSRKFSGKKVQNKVEALELARATRSENARVNALEKVQLLRETSVDYTKFGWIQKASEILDIVPQRVRWYLKQHAPDLLKNANVRNQKYKLIEK